MYERTDGRTRTELTNLHVGLHCHCSPTELPTPGLAGPGMKNTAMVMSNTEEGRKGGRQGREEGRERGRKGERKGVRKEGRKVERKEGREEGRAERRERGREEGRKEILYLQLCGIGLMIKDL